MENKLFSKTHFQQTLDDVQKDWDERIRKNNCANYERDNNLSEMEQNIADYIATKTWQEKMIEEDVKKFILQNPNTKTTCDDKIVESVRQKLLDRSNVGIKKYNTTLEVNNKDNYLKHAQEEAMDLANYLEKLIQQKENIVHLVEGEANDWELGKLIRKIYGK